jgi:hypothetical protein
MKSQASLLIIILLVVLYVGFTAYQSMGVLKQVVLA